MLAKLTKIIIVIACFIIGGILSILLYKNFSTKENNIVDTRIINHEIQRLNKMIVIEQNYSAFRTKKYNDYNPKYLNFLNKNIVLYITAKAQVTYDMKKMKINVDSVNKKINIIFLPEPELNVYPDVEIYSMEEGLFNNFSKADLNSVMTEGKKDIQKEVENSNIKLLAHNQLISNLKDLYIIARLYNWKIIDETPYAKELEPLKN